MAVINGKLPRIGFRSSWLSPALAAGMAIFPNCAISIGQPVQSRIHNELRQEEAVRLHSDLVIVSITATNQSGQFARGLKPEDFRVAEDGMPQKIAHFSAEETPFAATILFDMSGSMGYKFSLVRAAAASFLDHIRENDQVAVYGFNNTIRQFQDFSNARDITDYIWDARAEDNTRMYDCMDQAIDALVTREEKRRAVLLISDGWDSDSRRASFDSVLKKALSTGVTVYAIDLTDLNQVGASSRILLHLRRGRTEMREFAVQTGGSYVHNPQGDNLDQAFISIVDELRNQYTIGYYSSNARRDGKWRKVAITSKEDLRLRARRGYYASKAR